MKFSFFPQYLILAKDSVLPEVALKSTLLSLSAGKYLAKSFFLFIHSLTLFSIKSTTVIYIMSKCVYLDKLIIILIDWKMVLHNQNKFSLTWFFFMSYPIMNKMKVIWRISHA